MRINEKDQQIKKCEKLILMNVQNNFFCKTPYEKDQKPKKKIDFGDTPFYLRNIYILKPKY